MERRERSAAYFLTGFASWLAACTTPSVERSGEPARQVARPSVTDATMGTVAGADASATAWPDVWTTCRGPACPSTIPEAGAPCDASSLLCEYGDDPERGCNASAYCQADAGWQFLPISDSGCPTKQATPCPPMFGDAGADAACGASFRCHYAEGTCGCVLEIIYDDGGESYSWQCSPALMDSGCPPVRPRYGAQCDGSARCNYGGDCYSWLPAEWLECSCGEWRSGSFCPTVP